MHSCELKGSFGWVALPVYVPLTQPDCPKEDSRGSSATRKRKRRSSNLAVLPSPLPPRWLWPWQSLMDESDNVYVIISLLLFGSLLFCLCCYKGRKRDRFSDTISYSNTVCIICSVARCCCILPCYQRTHQNNKYKSLP